MSGSQPRGGREQGFLDGSRQFQGKEPLGGVGVILATFVNDADIAVAGGGLVGDKAVEFPDL